MSNSRLINTQYLLVPMGLLQELNHNLSAMAFLQMAKEQGVTLVAFDPQGLKPNLQDLMPLILMWDEKLKSSQCSPATFRAAILKLLGLSASDEDFDKAWNAMLGDIRVMQRRLNKIKIEHPEFAIILFSKTSSVHVKKTFAVLDPSATDFEYQMDNPLVIKGMPLYVSYLSPSCKMQASDPALYEEIIAKEKIEAEQLTIILQSKINSVLIAAKQRDEKNAETAQEWIARRNVKAIFREPGEDVSDAIQKSKNRGLKLASGSIRLFSFSQKAPELNPSEIVISANNYLRT